MDSAQPKPIDEPTLASLVSEFNSITQNHEQNVAVHYLEMSAYDLEKAISLFMENPPTIAQAGTHTQGQNTQQNINAQIYEQMSGFLPFMQQGGSNNGSALSNQVNTYKQYYREKEKREVEYEFHVISNIYKSSANAIKSIWNKFVPIAIRGETPGGEEFACFLHKTFGKMKTFPFIHGNVLENVEWAHSKNKMLLLFIYAIDPPSIKDLQHKLLKDEALIRYVTENFVIMGLLQSKTETNNIKNLYPEIKEPCLVAFRKNLYDKFIIVEQIPINESMPDPNMYLERIKGVKTLQIAQVQEEETIKKKALQEISIENQSRYFGYPGNQFFTYYDDYSDYGGYGQQQGSSRTQNPEVQRKLEMDRMLKKQQEEEYKMAQRLAEEQQRKKQKELEEKKMEEENRRIAEEEKVNYEKIQLEALKQKKSKLKPEPPLDDPEIFEVLFRLPNGNKITRRFRKSEEIENLYIYVETLDGLPFKATTQFDIIRTMPALNLSDKKNRKIAEIFEDSNQEMFHIREID